MKGADLLSWFEQLAAGKPKEFISGDSFSVAACSWQTSAASALTAAFPLGHRVLVEWERASQPKNAKPILNRIDAVAFETSRWNAICGVFASAHDQLREGRVEGLIDSVRADAESEVLEQAQALLEAELFAAAAVLAGGALEVHVRRLCEKSNLSLAPGHGTIDKYNSAIAQARNAGVVIYEKPEQSMVTAWAQLRNEAAHDPAQFNSTRTKADARQMLEGIRFFISKFR